MNNNEKEIILACQSGKMERFAEIYDLYVKKIYGFIYCKTFHRETAEDLTSETFLKALRGISKFKDEGNFSSWVYQIARNTVIDYYRCRKTAVNIDDVWDLGEDVDIEGSLDQKAKLLEVKKYLAVLPSIQRDIVLMRIWQEMSYQEIADAVGKTEENCRVIFSRTLSKLRSTMPLEVFLLLFGIISQ
ncbi:MAG: RNA polymerase sigma factor [bacterium]